MLDRTNIDDAFFSSPDWVRDRRHGRWSRLDDVERSFAVRAMTAYADGAFADDEHWGRYLDMATDVLALVRVGQLDIEDVNDLAAAHADLDDES